MGGEYTYLLSKGRRVLEWKRLNDAPVPAGFQKHEGRLYRRPVGAGEPVPSVDCLTLVERPDGGMILGFGLTLEPVRAYVSPGFFRAELEEAGARRETCGGSATYSVTAAAVLALNAPRLTVQLRAVERRAAEAAYEAMLDSYGDVSADRLCAERPGLAALRAAYDAAEAAYQTARAEVEK